MRSVYRRHHGIATEIRRHPLGFSVLSRMPVRDRRATAIRQPLWGMDGFIFVEKRTINRCRPNPILFGKTCWFLIFQLLCFRRKPSNRFNDFT